MEFSAVCSASAMTARIASCFRGRAGAWFECSDAPEPPEYEWWMPSGLGSCEGERGGFPRDSGGAVGKVW
jgi:hypothetical protein